MKITCGITLEYIANTTSFPIIRGDATKILVEKIDVYNEEYNRSNATHFGMYFKNDDTNTATILKKVLLNTSAYSHITQAITNKSDKQVINSLCNYYEGEDFIERNIKQAFSTLNNRFYKGSPRSTPSSDRSKI